jgi:hypothetical protein
MKHSANPNSRKINKKIKKLKKEKYKNLDNKERLSQKSSFTSSYDDSDSKFEKYLDDDKSL